MATVDLVLPELDFTLVRAPGAGGDGLLTITESATGESTDYLITLLGEDDREAAVQLHKIEYRLSDDTHYEGGVVVTYTIGLRSGDNHCDCPAGRWRRIPCRHVRALLKLWTEIISA